MRAGLLCVQRFAIHIKLPQCVCCATYVNVVCARRRLGLLSTLHISALVSCAYMPLSPAEAAAASPERRQWADEPLLSGGGAGGAWSGGHDGAFLGSLVGEGAARLVKALPGAGAPVHIRAAVRTIAAAVLLHARAVGDAVAVEEGRAPPSDRLKQVWSSAVALVPNYRVFVPCVRSCGLRSSSVWQNCAWRVR